jgi:cytochrome b
MSNKQSVKVWDLPTRLFHWLLVLSFIAAYFTSEFHLGFLHYLIGYLLCLLFLARLLWGFTGNRYARFKSFIFSPQETLAYIRSMRQNNLIHYYGHNPAGALMVFTVMALLLFIFMTGLITLAVIDFEGPLLFLANYLDDETSYAFRHLHGWLIDIALVVIPLHVLGVFVGCFQHKENLVRAMITGNKKNISAGISEQ